MDTLYRQEYLKYKKDYLVLKNDLSGGRIFNYYFELIFILDEDTYNTVKRLVLHNDLSIAYIHDIINGCAIKIVEGSDDVTFINNTSKDDMIKRNFKRRAGIGLNLKMAEYKLKNNTKQNFAKLNKKYKFGANFVNARIVKQLSELVVNKLTKRSHIFFMDPDADTKEEKPYEDIFSAEAFYGVMIFKWSKISCDFIEAYKLTKTQNEINSTDQSYGFKINTIATLKNRDGETRLELIKDTNIYSPDSEFITIKSS